MSSIQTATDELCRTVEAHTEDLRHVRLGRRFTIKNCDFRLLKADRNTIYHVANRNRWYLKLSRSRDTDCVRRERLGLEAVRTELTGNAGYRHPTAWRVSVENAYVLTSEVPGRSLLACFYRSMLNPFPTSRRRVTAAFSLLGNCLAQLHAVEVSVDLTQPRTLRGCLLRTCRQSKHPDDLCRQVEQAAESLPEIPTGPRFMHGNLGLNNVLSSAGQITMIDFECSGRGSAYDDLSLVCGNLLYASAASHVSTRRIHAAIHAFLSGYQQHGCFDPSLLSRCLALRVGEKYVYFICNNRRPTVAGLPLSRRRLRALMTTLLQGGDLSILNRPSSA